MGSEMCIRDRYVVANMLMSLTLTQEDLAIPEPEGADFDGMP